MGRHGVGLDGGVRGINGRIVVADVGAVGLQVERPAVILELPAVPRAAEGLALAPKHNRRDATPGRFFAPAQGDERARIVLARTFTTKSDRAFTGTHLSI